MRTAKPWRRESARIETRDIRQMTSVSAPPGRDTLSDLELGICTVRVGDSPGFARTMTRPLHLVQGTTVSGGAIGLSLLDASLATNVESE